MFLPWFPLITCQKGESPDGSQPSVPASGFCFQLLAHFTPSSSRILGDCRAADGNLAWAELFCGRLIFSPNPEGGGHRSLQL